MITIRIFALGILLLASVIPARAVEVDEVVTSGPSWETFTNQDGTGLYHEVLREVFALYDIPVRHEYVPTDRGDEMVLEGLADMMICDDHADEPLKFARFPLYVDGYYAFFKKARIGPWNGVETLRGREIVSQLGYYAERDFPVRVSIRQMTSGVQCLNMILLNRSDFYVDDMAFIEKSIEETDLSFDPKEYESQMVGIRSYHPLFSPTQRGEAIQKMFEEGIMTLHKAGKLKPIYEKWGYKYPDFDAF